MAAVQQWAMQRALAQPIYGPIDLDDPVQRTIAAAEAKTMHNSGMEVWTERKRRIKQEKKDEKMRAAAAAGNVPTTQTAITTVEPCPASLPESNLKRQDSATDLGAADTVAVEIPYTTLDGAKRTAVFEIDAVPRAPLPQRRRAHSVVSAPSVEMVTATARKEHFVKVEEEAEKKREMHDVLVAAMSALKAEMFVREEGGRRRRESLVDGELPSVRDGLMMEGGC